MGANSPWGETGRSYRLHTSVKSDRCNVLKLTVYITMASIWRKNMPGYLSADIISSEKRTVPFSYCHAIRIQHAAQPAYVEFVLT